MKKRAGILLCAATLALTVGGLTIGGTEAQAHSGSTGPSTASVCGRRITVPQVAGAEVQSVGGVLVAAGTDQNGGTPIANVPAHCAVTLYLTHPGASDHVLVEVWLPTSGWNGRFEGTGGGGYAAGEFDVEMAPAIQSGFAAAGTDAGVGNNVLSPAAWALNADGSVDSALLTNFAYRSVHDMTVAAKQIVTAYYGRSAAYSYWNGCSTGGRQGLMEAQRFPADYNGILADAPAINWGEFIPSELWPQVVMNETKDYPTSCEFDAFDTAAVAACDKSDPVNGGIIDDPVKCGFDPRSMIGKTVLCNGRTLTITAADAGVVRLIWQGPKTPQGRQLWYGLTKGAPFEGLAGTATTAGGAGEGAPFPIAAAWVSYFLKQDPSFDVSTITYAQFTRIFEQSVREYGSIIGTNDPDLGAFERAGGKMITWHGLSDQLIFPQGTIDYYERVRAATGGARNVSSFYRLFLAPGVQHCGLGNGPVPTDPLSALTAWVEHGQAPNVLAASTVTAGGSVIGRDLHPFK